MDTRRYENPGRWESATRGGKGAGRSAEGSARTHPQREYGPRFTKPANLILFATPLDDTNFSDLQRDLYDTIECRLNKLPDSEIYVPHKRVKELTPSERMHQLALNAKRAKLVLTDLRQSSPDVFYILGSLVKDPKVPIVPFYSGERIPTESLQLLKLELSEFGQVTQAIRISDSHAEEELGYLLDTVKRSYGAV